MYPRESRYGMDPGKSKNIPLQTLIEISELGRPEEGGSDAIAARRGQAESERVR